jgi:hypothetical protein
MLVLAGRKEDAIPGQPQSPSDVLAVPVLTGRFYVVLPDSTPIEAAGIIGAVRSVGHREVASPDPADRLR